MFFAEKYKTLEDIRKDLQEGMSITCKDSGTADYLWVYMLTHFPIDPVMQILQPYIDQQIIEISLIYYRNIYEPRNMIAEECIHKYQVLQKIFADRDERYRLGTLNYARYMDDPQHRNPLKMSYCDHQITPIIKYLLYSASDQEKEQIVTFLGYVCHQDPYVGRLVIANLYHHIVRARSERNIKSRQVVKLVKRFIIDYNVPARIVLIGTVVYNSRQLRWILRPLLPFFIYKTNYYDRPTIIDLMDVLSACRSQIEAEQFIKTFQRRGLNINELLPNKITPLIYFNDKLEHDICKALLKCGANPCIKCVEQRPAIDILYDLGTYPGIFESEDDEEEVLDFMLDCALEWSDYINIRGRMLQLEAIKRVAIDVCY